MISSIIEMVTIPIKMSRRKECHSRFSNKTGTLIQQLIKEVISFFREVFIRYQLYTVPP